MAGTDTTSLEVAGRKPEGSRSVRRLRREGFVPGIVYGDGKDPVAFSVQSRELRIALANAGAVIDLKVDGKRGTPVVLKELVRHPVNGETMHIDLLRVRLDQTLQATVTLELTGAEDAPGVKGGGVLEQQLRELTIEALPGDIPDSITHDVSELEIGDSVTLSSIKAPAGLTIVGDPETMVASISSGRLKLESDTDIEAETEVVGEGEEGGEASEGSDSESGESGDAAESSDSE